MTSERTTAVGDATITASGIARLANVGRAAVSNWRRRYADFPAPVGGTPTSPSFNAREVEQWLRRQGKLHQTGIDQWVWRHIESYQPAAQIGDALGIVGAYLLGRSLQPAGNTSALLSPKQLVKQLRTLDRELATTVDRVLPDQWGHQLTVVLGMVDELARDQDPETAFEFLHSQYVASAQSMSGLASTPDTVTEIMLTIAGPGTSTLDFTCGTGSILRMAADRSIRAGSATRCYGQEIKPQYALIALVRLWFTHHRAGGTGHPAEPPVLHVGDSLLGDAFTGLRSDVVVANFPFGIHDWGHDQLAYDSRWAYGMPPRTEPELAWVQHALAHLSPSGTAVVLMPPAAAQRPAGRRVRAELVRSGALRAVVALPAGLMPPAGIGLHIWVLTQPDQRQPLPDQLLFVDAAAAADGPLTELIDAAWHNHRSGSNADMPGVYRAVPAIDVLDDKVDLTPQRYLPPTDTLAIDPTRTMTAIAELDRQLKEIRRGLPKVRPATATATALRTAPQASIGDLVRSGSMTILRAHARTRSSPSTGDDNTSTPGAVGSTGPSTDAADDPLRILPGDILIPLLGREIAAHVAAKDQSGAELEAGVQALRVDPARFDPWFIAGVLSRTNDHRIARRISNAGSGTLRIDLRRLTIPVLTLHDQQEYGQAFRQLTEFRARLERTAVTGAALAREISDGLTSGTLAVHVDRISSIRTTQTQTRAALSTDA